MGVSEPKMREVPLSVVVNIEGKHWDEIVAFVSEARQKR